MAITSANQLELLQTAEAVAREKQIEPGLVVEAMEESLSRAAKSRYGAEMDIRVTIDRKTGRATFTRVRSVVDEEEFENYQSQFTPEQAKPYFEDSGKSIVYWVRDGQKLTDYAGGPQIGDRFEEEVPPVEMGRIAAQSAKQVILQKVREAERDKQYEEFKDRAGTIINVPVKREEYGKRHRRIEPRRRHPAPQREDRPRIVPSQRPHPRLHQGRAPRAARPADFPEPYRARVHGRAVQDGSARDLRRHHRDQGRGP